MDINLLMHFYSFIYFRYVRSIETIPKTIFRGPCLRVDVIWAGSVSKTDK